MHARQPGTAPRLRLRFTDGTLVDSMPYGLNLPGDTWEEQTLGMFENFAYMYLHGEARQQMLDIFIPACQQYDAAVQAHREQASVCLGEAALSRMYA